jgi:hypothetical protein
VKDHPGLPGDGGYFLHAERLQFAHPSTGEDMTVTATPPLELQTREEFARTGKNPPFGVSSQQL